MMADPGLDYWKRKLMQKHAPILRHVQEAESEGTEKAEPDGEEKPQAERKRNA